MKEQDGGGEDAEASECEDTAGVESCKGNELVMMDPVDVPEFHLFIIFLPKGARGKRGVGQVTGWQPCRGDSRWHY